MQLRYWKNIAPAVDGMQKIAAVTWSPNGKKLAVATSDRVFFFNVSISLNFRLFIYMMKAGRKRKDSQQSPLIR